MEKLKTKIFDIVVIAVLIVVMVLVDNRNFRIIGGVVIIFLIIDIFSKPVEDKENVKKEADPDNPEDFSDDEVEEQMLEDGEYNYDNYDEVCCPKCGAYLGVGVTECNECGWGKSKYPEICPKCGKPNTDQLPFCAYCDYKFEKQEDRKNEYTKDSLVNDEFADDILNGNSQSSDNTDEDTEE